jgi:hypothetical protein
MTTNNIQYDSMDCQSGIMPLRASKAQSLVLRDGNLLQALYPVHTVERRSLFGPIATFATGVPQTAILVRAGKLSVTVVYRPPEDDYEWCSLIKQSGTTQHAKPM